MIKVQKLNNLPVLGCLSFTKDGSGHPSILSNVVSENNNDNIHIMRFVRPRVNLKSNNAQVKAHL